MNRAILLCALLVGCKGETVTKIDPQTQADLDKCKKDKDDLDAYKKKLEAENAQLLQKGSGAEIVVTIEGELMKVKAPQQGTGVANPPVDPKLAEKGSKDFQNVVYASRGAIQKCYEQALKKNTGLQAKTVTLTVLASFASSGAYRTSSFAPSLGDTFDSCMQNVASKWALPTNSPAMTFKAQVSLTPS
jgi:hypothetical protein